MFIPKGCYIPPAPEWPTRDRAQDASDAVSLVAVALVVAMVVVVFALVTTPVVP